MLFEYEVSLKKFMCIIEIFNLINYIMIILDEINDTLRTMI